MATTTTNRKGGKSAKEVERLRKLAEATATERKPEEPSPVLVAEKAAKEANDEVLKLATSGAKPAAISEAAKKAAELRVAVETARKEAAEKAVKDRETKAAARKVAMDAVATAEKAMTEAVTSGKPKLIVEAAKVLATAKAELEAMGPAPKSGTSRVGLFGGAKDVLGSYSNGAAGKINAVILGGGEWTAEEIAEKTGVAIARVKGHLGWHISNRPGTFDLTGGKYSLGEIGREKSGK